MKNFNMRRVKHFITDFLSGTAFIASIVMAVCSILMGVLVVAAMLGGECSLTDGVLTGLVCAAVGGCAIAILKQLDFLL